MSGPDRNRCVVCLTYHAPEANAVEATRRGPACRDIDACMARVRWRRDFDQMIARRAA